MKSDLNSKELISKLSSFLRKLQRYAAFIFIIALLGIYGFLVFRINTLNSREPSDDAVTEKLQTVKRPKIDQSAVDKIQQLQDQHVEVKSLFDQARNNPFSE
jgi:hypothetical protein